MAQKRAEEEAFRRPPRGRPELAADCDAAYEDDRQIARSLGGDPRPNTIMLEGGQAFHCRLFAIARTLVRMAEESAKPNADRLREYRESNLESLKEGLFSDAPIYDDLETLLLADSLGMYLEQKGCGGRATTIAWPRR